VGVAFIAAFYAIGVHYRLVEIWRAREKERRYNRDHSARDAKSGEAVLHDLLKDKKVPPRFLDPDC
jgi:hypothetical protein